MTTFLARLEHELFDKPASADVVLQLPDLFPAPAPEGTERVIRCRTQNLDRAIARAFARAVAWGECWKLEMVA